MVEGTIPGNSRPALPEGGWYLQFPATPDATRRILSENSEHAHAYFQVFLSSRFTSATLQTRRSAASGR